MARDAQHEPVLADTVAALFDQVPGGVVLDATLGLGGHAAALLSANPRVVVLGLDRDRDALALAEERLRPFGPRAVVQYARFADLRQVVDVAWAAGGGLWPSAGEAAVSPTLSGALFDLGVSSLQLDRPERGFSYRRDAPLDMRMDASSGPRALEVVNEATEADLTRWFAANGETRLARRLARAIVVARPLATTGQLARVVEAAVPAAVRRRGHPASRVFQAIRIVVNDELGELATALPAALDLLSVGGRCVVISYHSGEDRLVKDAFAVAASGGCSCPPGLPCRCGAVVEYRLVFRGARKALPAEIERNPRASSARLRAIERIGPRPVGRS
ncbi:MAG TPA: 16S rRNA (cytosine(1402)-N(4))-methyltransferase RsmH [Acidimicrobiales bacterium]|nr:16S rRNA (cytosine(1402)-N(4))-methyltransferase RsmH [Acidimicrobiales bacterium]